MADIESSYTLDVSQVLAALDQVGQKFESTEDHLRKAGKGNVFKEAALSAADLDKELSAGIKTMATMEGTTASLKEEIKKLTAEQEKLVKKQGDLDAAFKSDNIKKQIQSVQAEQKKLGTEVENTTKKAGGLRGMISGVADKAKGLVSGLTGSGGALSTFGGIAAGTFAIAATAVAAVGFALYKARERYMEMNDAMLATIGNQQDVTHNMEVLDTVASSLDMTLASVTSAYGTLANEGLKPTKTELKNLGVLSQELKTDFTNLSTAIVAADKGQVESLRKLGVQAQTHGDNIELSFRGVTSTFKKGSGESVKALDEISRKMEKTENSAAGFGRLDFMDRLAKGFVDTENAIGDATESVDKKAYPAFDRLFKLFSSGKNYVLDLAESFGIWLSSGWATIVNDASFLVSILGYQFDVLTHGFKQANQNLKTAKDAFLKNRKEIFEEEKKLQANVGKDQGGELINNNVKLVPDDKEAERAREKAKRDAKKRADDRRKELLKAEKDLQDALTKLQAQYGKDKLEALKGDTLKYLEEKKKLDLAQIDLEENALLKLKQIAVGARNGRFDSDNKPIPDKKTTLSKNETEPFAFRRQLVTDQNQMEVDKYNKEVAEKAAANEKKITEALSNEYQLQLQAIEHKYEELFKLSELDGKRRLQLEKKKEQEIAKATLENDLSKIDKESAQEMQDAELNVIKAQISGRMDLEIQARQGLLEIEKKFILQKIKLLEASSDPQAQAAVAGFKKAIAEIDKGIADLGKSNKKKKGIEKYLSEQLHMSDEDVANAIDAAQTFASSITSIYSELYSTLNQLSEKRIARIDDEINKKKEQLDAEKELNEKGLANNLDLREKELATLKAARERALKDQQRLQRAQLLVDTATQASSMISAAAKVYSGFAGIPVVGVGLGVAAVALMLGAFAAAKIKAFQLVKQGSAEKFEDGGEVGGRRHSEGGTLIEAEKGEYVTNRKSTAKYYDLIEAINHDNQSHVMDYLLKDLLSGTGIGMSEPERKKALRFMHKHDSAMQSKENDMINELREVKEELVFIKKHTSKISDIHYVSTGENKIAKIGPNSTVVTELPKK